jgi:hypothetical protein
MCYTLKHIEIYHAREYTSLQSGDLRFNINDMKIFVATMRWYVSHINDRNVLYRVLITHIEMGPLKHVRNKYIFITE